MKNNLLLATNNLNKILEIKSLLSQSSYKLLTPQDLGISLDVAETGVTFEENALIKAKAFFEVSKIPTLAEDSGIEVDALEGRPGVYSARYAGKGASDEDNIRKLLFELKGIPENLRTARYKVVFALIQENYSPQLFDGALDGIITQEPKGVQGFGYDPIFFIKQLNKTAAEITMLEKNQVSHRAKALADLLSYLENRNP